MDNNNMYEWLRSEHENALEMLALLEAAFQMELVWIEFLELLLNENEMPPE